MIIQIVIIVFAVFVLSKVFLKFKAQDITGKEFLVWVVFWLGVILATIKPRYTDIIAKLFGVARGADLLVYVSIIVIFFVIFKILVKQEKIDKDITKVVRRQALDQPDKETNKQHQL